MNQPTTFPNIPSLETVLSNATPETKEFITSHMNDLAMALLQAQCQNAVAIGMQSLPIPPLMGNNVHLATSAASDQSSRQSLSDFIHDAIMKTNHVRGPYKDQMSRGLAELMEGFEERYHGTDSYNFKGFPFLSADMVAAILATEHMMNKFVTLREKKKQHILWLMHNDDTWAQHQHNMRIMAQAQQQLEAALPVEDARYRQLQAMIPKPRRGGRVRRENPPSEDVSEDDDQQQEEDTVAPPPARRQHIAPTTSVASAFAPAHSYQEAYRLHQQQQHQQHPFMNAMPSSPPPSHGHSLLSAPSSPQPYSHFPLHSSPLRYGAQSPPLHDMLGQWSTMQPFGGLPHDDLGGIGFTSNLNI